MEQSSPQRHLLEEVEFDLGAHRLPGECAPQNAMADLSVCQDEPMDPGGVTAQLFAAQSSQEEVCPVSSPERAARELVLSPQQPAAVVLPDGGAADSAALPRREPTSKFWHGQLHGTS